MTAELVTVTIDGMPVAALPPISKFSAEYLNAEEAAAYIKVHPQTLRKWVRLGVFPRIPLPGEGKDFRFSKKQIDEWAEARTLGVRN